MSSGIYLFPDRGSEQGSLYDEYSEHTQEGLSRRGRFGSLGELEQFLSDPEWASFTVATPGSQPVVLEQDCTAAILIDRFLDGGQERWQSFYLIKNHARRRPRSQL